MKYLNQPLVALCIAMACSVASARPSMQDVEASVKKANVTEESLFTKTIYPFVRKNCAECHGEQAFYPVGPSHSHSNPKMAFQTFSKLLDRNDYTSSRFIKFASNKHFCKEFTYNCDKQDQVITELSRLFGMYVTDAKKINPTQTTDKSNWAVQPGQTVNTQNIVINGHELQLETVVRIYQQDYIKVVSVSLLGTKKLDLALDGMEFRVNNHLPAKTTGFETLKRELSFDGITPMKTKLSLTREIILKAKPGDQLSLKLLNLREHNLTAHTSACENSELSKKIFADIKASEGSISMSIFGSYEAFAKRTPKQICAQILLSVNKQAPSQSILIQQLPKTVQASFTGVIANWLKAAEKKPTLPPVTQMVAAGESFCYGTATDLYCLGSQTLTLPVKDGLRRIAIGGYSVAFENKNNQWTFIDGYQDIPSEVKRSDSHDFGFEVLDLQISNDIACYLTPNHELFCGGDYAKEIFILNNRNNFYKVSDLKIKEFNLRGTRILALDMTGKIFYFGREDSERRSESTHFIKKILGEKEYFEISGLKSIAATNMVFTFSTHDHKIYAYTNAEYFTNSLAFGENFIQGNDISEGFELSQLSFAAYSMCGLNKARELMCRGSYVSGLVNDAREGSSKFFRKIVNAPKNIKKIVSGHFFMCMLLESNQITCAGDIRVQANQVTDGRGRRLYIGNDDNTPKFTAPHFIDKIE